MYGDLTDDVLLIELPTIDDEFLTIKEMIDLSIKDEIISTSHILEYNADEEDYEIGRLTIWTEKNIYLLICGPFGYFLMEEIR